MGGLEPEPGPRGGTGGIGYRVGVRARPLTPPPARPERRHGPSPGGPGPFPPSPKIKNV